MHLELSQFSSGALLNKIMYCLFSVFVSLQLQDSELCFGIHWNLKIIPDPGETQTCSNHPSSQCYNTVTHHATIRNSVPKYPKSSFIFYFWFLRQSREQPQLQPQEDSSPPKPLMFIFISLNLFHSTQGSCVCSRGSSREICFLCVLGLHVENKTQGVPTAATWECGHSTLGRSRKGD